MDTSDGNAKAMIQAAFNPDQAKIVEGILEMVQSAVGDIKGTVGEIKEGLKTATEDIADLRRQNTKSCGILRGPDLPKRTIGENVLQVFTETIMKKYSIRVNREDLAAVHRLPNGSIVAKFVDLKEGSVFDKLVRRFGDWNPCPSLKIDFSMQISEYDGTIRAILGMLKKEGKIQTYNTSASGKQRFRVGKDKNWITIATIEEALNLLDQETKAKFIQSEAEFIKNRNQKRRERRRRIIEGQGQGQEQGQSMIQKRFEERGGRRGSFSSGGRGGKRI